MKSLETADSAEKKAHGEPFSLRIKTDYKLEIVICG